MNPTPPNTVIFVVLLVAVVLAVVAWLIVQRQRSPHLKRRLGPEYDLTVSAFHSGTKAELELQKREDQVARLKIVPLTPTDAARFSQAWNELQSGFIDNPKEVVAHADQLVRELMEERGYPVGDFERRAADISVDHPAVVATYRVAQGIAASEARGEADTEELRKAVIYYRTLFDELLGVAHDRVASLPPVRRVPVHS
jgi:hypothetical protein